MENQAQNVQENYCGNDQVETESTYVISKKKIFIGGLTLETTDTDLLDYFEKFGQINTVDLKIDHVTRKSKGYGFIVFNAAESIAQITAIGEHVINNKKVDVQAAKERVTKLFVGGIRNDITDEDIKSYFAHFGNIIGVEMPYDRTTNQHKHFCFVIFESEQVARKMLKYPNQMIKDNLVHIKRLMTKTNQRFSAQSNAGTLDRNWGQTLGYQTYGGYSFNNQQGHLGIYGGFYNGYGPSSSSGYVRTDQHTAIPSYFNPPIGTSSNRGGSGGGRGDTFRGRGNKFQPF